MASRKAKGLATKASPVSLVCAWTCDYWRFALLQEKAVAVAGAQAVPPSAPAQVPAFEAAHVQRADRDARAAGCNLIHVFI